MYVFGQKEQVLRDVDLGKDAGIPHQGGQPLPGGFAEVGKDQVPTKKIGGVVRGAPSEELGKHQAHYQKGEERGEDAPSHPQYGAFVFLFKIAFYKLFKKETVLQKPFYHLDYTSLLTSRPVSQYNRIIISELKIRK